MLPTDDDDDGNNLHNDQAQQHPALRLLDPAARAS
jgi:hypothetical protein